MAGDEDLHVDPQALSKYGLAMLLYSAQAGMPINSKLSSVEVDSSGAFSGLSGFQAGVFAEGPVMQAAMTKQAAAFASFIGDLNRGLQAIGNAADVCAYAYNATDIESAEKMNLLGYAFATDPDAKAPPGLPKGTGETLLDRELNGQSAGTQPDALANPDSGTTVQVYGSGFLTTYPDGSSKMVHSESVAGDPNASRAVTTITGPTGQVLSVTTTKTRYAASGTSSEYYREVVTPGQQVAVVDGKEQKSDPVKVTTETTDEPTGGKKVTTTTQVGEGKPSVSTVDVPAPTAKADQQAGPLEEAQDELGTDAGKMDWRKGYQGVEAPS